MYVFFISTDAIMSLYLIIFILLGKDYVFEALHINLLKSVQPFIKPQNIRSKPRSFDCLQKV